MEVLILSKNRAAADWFAPVRGSRRYALRTGAPEDLRAEVRGADPGTMVYLDVDSFAPAELTKTVRYLARQETIRYGILDPKGTVIDVAELFHMGASDYAGGELLQIGMTPKRLASVVAFVDIDEETEEKEAATSPRYDAPVSGRDWTAVRSGQEYTFCFLFVEMDNQEDMKREYGEASLRSFLGTFHEYIEAQVTRLHGRRWIWDEFGGLLLIPFDGVRCDAIVVCFQTILNHRLASIQLWDFDIIPSFRMVLHIGSTVYRARGATGNVISSAVNFVFHLGQKYAKPGNTYLTEELVRFIPEQLTEFFVPAGRFEGRDLMRMRLPR